MTLNMPIMHGYCQVVPLFLYIINNRRSDPYLYKYLLRDVEKNNFQQNKQPVPGKIP